MTRSPHESQKFARGSLPASAIGGPANSPRHGRAATFIIDDQKNGPGRAGAARRHCPIHIPAHQQGRAIPVAVGTVRILLPLTLFPYLAERFGARSFSALSQFAGFGAGTSLPFAINTYAADNSRKHCVKPLKRHFQNSASVNAPNLDRGGHDAVTHKRASGTPNDR